MNPISMRRCAIVTICALSGALALVAPVSAQTYPERAVKIIVAYSPGSNPDVATRVVAQALQQRLGQPFVVENKIGAGGSVGLGVAARAAPDGYTITVGHIGALTINPVVYSKLSYDANKDFVPITQMYKAPLILLVAQSSPYRSIADIVAAAKAKPDDLTFSSGANGTGAHLSGESLASLSSVSIRHIPYRSVSESLIGVANGDVTFSFGNQSLGLPMVQSKKLRAIAVSGDERVPEFPDAPPVGDTIKGFVYYDWSGLLAPAGTPPAIVAKLQQEVSAVLAQPEVIERMRAQGLMPVRNTSEEFARLIAGEQKKWGQLARQINLKLD